MKVKSEIQPTPPEEQGKTEQHIDDVIGSCIYQINNNQATAPAIVRQIRDAFKAAGYGKVEEAERAAMERVIKKIEKSAIYIMTTGSKVYSTEGSDSTGGVITFAERAYVIPIKKVQALKSELPGEQEQDKEG